jgi:hypothetical protein
VETLFQALDELDDLVAILRQHWLILAAPAVTRPPRAAICARPKPVEAIHG